MHPSIGSQLINSIFLRADYTDLTLETQHTIQTNHEIPTQLQSITFSINKYIHDLMKSNTLKFAAASFVYNADVLFANNYWCS